MKLTFSTEFKKFNDSLGFFIFDLEYRGSTISRNFTIIFSKEWDLGLVNRKYCDDGYFGLGLGFVFFLISKDSYYE